jgi:cytoskeletal protein CcmA (bactofilin family)
MSHLDEMTGLLYLEGQLGAEQNAEISAHLPNCGECRALVQALQKESLWLKEALISGEAIPARLAHVRKPLISPWTWVAVLGVAAGGIYTLWNGLVDPWLTQAADSGFNSGNVLTMLFFSGAFWKGWDSMQSTIEFLPLAIAGIFLIWLLRRRWRRFTLAAVVLLAWLGGLALAQPASATEVAHGDPNYTLESGQVVHSDLIVAAEHTRIDGDVDGDLIVSSRSITVNGHVGGDILAFGQELHVNGPVDGNVRVFAQSLTLNGAVGKNLMAWAREIDMEENARVGGSVIVGAADAQLDGRVAADLLAFSEVLDLNGRLDKDATIRGERLRIGPNAELLGHLRFRGGRQPQIASGAKLSNPIQILSRARSVPSYASPSFYWRQVLAWGASFLSGVVLLLIAPAFFTDVENASKRIGPAFGFGFLFLFAIPIAAVLACLTIVGLGVGIATLLLYIVAIYSAQIFIGSRLGEKLTGTAVGVGASIGKLALGLAILRVLRMLPFAGRLIGLAVVVWGLGALVLAIHKRLRPQFATAA